MRKRLNSLAIVAVMISFLTTTAIAAPSDAEDVRKTVIGFSTAWNQHDMVAFGKLFAPDADFVNVAGFQMKGRKDIQMHHAWSHGTVPPNSEVGGNLAHYGIFKKSTMRFIKIDVRFLRKDVAIAHVNWELLADARTPNPRQGVLLFVLTRQNGGWMIASAQNTEINRKVK